MLLGEFFSLCYFIHFCQTQFTFTYLPLKKCQRWKRVQEVLIIISCYDSILELKWFSYFACKSKIQASRVQGNCSVLIQTLLQSHGWGRIGITECHILLTFHSVLLALRYTGDCSYRQFQVNSIFYLVSSGQHAHIFWWLVVIYLLVIINMEELSDWHMSNRNLSYVSVEKTNYMALQIKLCFLNSSAFLDQTQKYQVEKKCKDFSKKQRGCRLLPLKRCEIRDSSPLWICHTQPCGSGVIIFFLPFLTFSTPNIPDYDLIPSFVPGAS